MNRFFARTTLIMLIMLFASPAARTEEGMWFLDSVQKLPLDTMKTHGLELTAADIYRPDGTSLKDAVVLLSGGTGSFISNAGLILTNHHVAYGAIQSLSSPENDYLEKGFLAHTHEEELSTSYTADIVVGLKDVTREVLSAVSDTMAPADRSLAIRTKTRAIEAEATGAGDLTSRVSELYGGASYYLFTFLTLKDVRLVYAPPSSIGNFGGEVDNWIWPRHTGDFSIMRAYTAPDGKPALYARENIPYVPKKFLPVSRTGGKKGEFAMVMGFPGRTYRYMESAGVRLAIEQTLPTLIDLYGVRMSIIEEMGKDDRTLQIKYASKLRRLNNPYKKYIGTLECMRRADVVNLKEREETAFRSSLASLPDLRQGYGTLLHDMDSVTQRMRKVNLKSQMFANLNSAVELLGIARRLITYTEGFPHDSLGNTLEPTEKEKGPVREYLKKVFRNLDIRVDREMLIAMILKSDEMPPEGQITVLRKITGDKSGRELRPAIREYADELYEETALASQAGCEKLLDKDSAAILDDPCIRLASDLSEEEIPITAEVMAYNSAIGRLRSSYVDAWLKWKDGRLIYPDANRTLRLTYGLVEGLEPRDGVRYSPFTTLGGVMEKETGVAPFIVPEPLRTLWEKKDFGPYADPKLGDVPVAFLATLDSTGGNSGSPVINGKGELIGCAFDGNWESLAGDYQYQGRYDRSINVDSPYILFLLDKFAGAKNILQELVIR